MQNKNSLSKSDNFEREGGGDYRTRICDLLRVNQTGSYFHVKFRPFSLISYHLRTAAHRLCRIFVVQFSAIRVQAVSALTERPDTTGGVGIYFLLLLYCNVALISALGFFRDRHRQLTVLQQGFHIVLHHIKHSLDAEVVRNLLPTTGNTTK